MTDYLSPISLARRLRELELFYFSPASLAALLTLDQRGAHRAASRLQAQGLAVRVEKGKYLLTGLEPERILSNPLFIASQLVLPCYVSYWSALHYHGFTTQVPHTSFVATVKKKRPVQFGGHTYRFVTVQPHQFFGYCREILDALPLLVADEAKAIVDSLDQPRYAGGLLEVAQALRNALPELDLDLLGEYAGRMGDASLGSRLGYLLELLDRPRRDLPISRTPIALDPARERRGRLVSRWQLVVNLPEADLLAPGIG